MRWLLFLMGAAWLPAQEWTVPCEAPPATLRILESLPAVHDHSLSYEDRIGARRALAEKYPDDFFIQREYQDSFRYHLDLAPEFDRALALYRSRGADPLARYLEGRLLLVSQPKRTQAIFDELAKTYPRFLWPQLDMVEWNHVPGRRNAKEAEARLRSFLGACPAAAEVLSYSQFVDDPELRRSIALALRGTLERRNSPVDYVLWPALWTLENRAGLANKMREDLKRMESSPLRPHLELFWVYRQAAEALKDPSILERFQARVAREAPDSALLNVLVRHAWSVRNPYPPRDAGQAAQLAYEQKERQAQAEWRARWPKDCGLINQWWISLAFAGLHGSFEPPLAERLAAADAQIRCHREVRDASSSVPPFETGLADAYVRWKVRLNEVPHLLDAGLAAADREQKYRLSEDLIPAEFRRPPLSGLSRTEEIRANYLLAVNRLAEARALVEQELAKPGSNRDNQRTYVRLLADVAAKQNQPEEALRLYRDSLAGIPREFLAKTDTPFMEPVHKYYLAHGGTPEKWLEWAGSGKPFSEPSKPHAPEFIADLPDFRAQDLSGRTWTLADLRGKATLINFWATWCGPCRGEHPELQKLHEKLKDRPDMQVLTFSVDDDPAVMRAYLQEKGFTFPVIRSREIADKLFPYAGLPTNLLVDSRGRRTTMYGFGDLDRIIADMQSALLIR